MPRIAIQTIAACAALAGAAALFSSNVRAQGAVNALCSTDAGWCEAAAAEFTRTTGIKVNQGHKGTGEIAAQLRAEAQNPKTDLWWGGTGDPFLQAAEQGLVHPDARRGDESAIVPPAPRTLTSNRRAFLVLVRNELFRRVQFAALDRPDRLAELDPDFGEDAWTRALDAYYSEHDSIGTDTDARSSAMLIVDESDAQTARVWHVRQILADPAGDHDWGIAADVDLAASDEAGAAVVRVTAVDTL